MTEKKTSDAQIKASRKWQEKNKEQMNYIRKRSAARGFLKIATIEDIQELEQLIEERKKDIKLQKFEEEQPVKNNENPLLTEGKNYDKFFENKHVKFARVTFAGDTEATIFENRNYGSLKHRPEWFSEKRGIYHGIVDANPTGTLADISNAEISVDGAEWHAVKDLAKKFMNNYTDTTD